MEKPLLPPNYIYREISNKEDEYTFRIKDIRDKSSVLAWFDEFCDITKSTWRKSRTNPKTSKSNHFKFDLRCVLNTDRRVTGKRSSKHTGCPAKIAITLKRDDADPDGIHRDYPTVINIRGSHNHAATLKHRDLSDDIKLKFKKLIKQGHSIASALKIHKTDLMREYGDQYYLIADDGKYLPTYSILRNLFKKERRKMSVEYSEVEMLPCLEDKLKIKLALIQCTVSPSKGINLKRASAFIKEAAQNGANLVCLPECFNAPYGVSYFNQYAESIPGCTDEMLSKSAKENNVYLIGGTFIERDDGKLFNTCLAYGPDGELLANHHKIHLSDIDTPGKTALKESDVLSPGNSLTTFTMGKWKIGLGICHDIRFPLMANIYAEKGCNLLVYPGAFNMTTGPAHWELLQRALAVNNQLYVATVSPARDETASYQVWGHSTLVNPWGSIVATTEEKEAIVYGEIDAAHVLKVREQIPIQYLKRNDLYHIEYKSFVS